MERRLSYLLTVFLLGFSTEISAFFATNDSIFLVFVGDIMQHKTQIDAVTAPDGSFNYEPCFRLVRDEIASADLAMGNLETTLGGKPYSGYPMFSAPDEFALALKELGFDVLLTANNHSLDRGVKGAKRTIAVLDSLDIRHTGLFNSAEEREQRYPLMLSVKDIKIALLNYTYGTNGIPFQKPFIVNLIDSARIVADIAQAKLAEPDLIIAFMHWGDEEKRYPNAVQKRLTEMLFEQGVNLVIGAHPHVVQSMEKRYLDNGRCNRLVAYSLGNFVSNQPFVNTDGGAILKVAIVCDTVGIRIVRAEYSLVWVYKPKENGRTRHYLLPVANFENDDQLLDARYKKALELFTGNARKLLNKENIGVSEYRIFPIQ
ncbi:MAG: CapA family protein [Prevotellaceae bacterium]|jgi:poly-gamma-glutamate synthesis protein (capsule biosynthesis protein)|nr:CapA family protein [Prevotellaceae bacterium]